MSESGLRVGGFKPIRTMFLNLQFLFFLMLPLAVIVRIFQTGHQMDYIRLVINIILTIAFYYFFGRVNIDTFSQASVSYTKREETMDKVPSPGKRI